MLFIATVVIDPYESIIIVDTVEANTIEAATMGLEMEDPNAISITVEEDQH